MPQSVSVSLLLSQPSDRYIRDIFELRFRIVTFHSQGSNGPENLCISSGVQQGPGESLAWNQVVLGKSKKQEFVPDVIRSGLI